MSLNKINIDWVLKWLMKIIISKDFSLQANAFNGFLTLQIDLLIICLNIYANVMTDDIPQKVNWHSQQCSSRTRYKRKFCHQEDDLIFSLCLIHNLFNDDYYLPSTIQIPYNYCLLRKTHFYCHILFNRTFVGFRFYRI